MEGQGTQSIQVTKEYDNLRDAYIAAAEAATASFGLTVMGVLYTQAGRRFISTSLPIKMLVSIIRRDSAGKKDDPGSHRNRPLDTSHVKAIADYLRSEQKYLLPPIMLNAASTLQIFMMKTSVPTKPCFFVLPPEEYLYVTDGQHRLEAVRQAIIDKPDMASDSIGVTIVEEGNIDKVHQDFYDAAQNLQLARSLLVEFDGREPINSITREASAKAKILKGRVEKVSNTVGKNSLMMFTSNQVKQGVIQLLVGDWSLYNEAMQRQAKEVLAPARELWGTRVVAFFDEFTADNPQWKHISERPLDAGLAADVPGIREKYLHFSGAGLLVLCGVGHTILQESTTSDGSLSDQQKAQINHLASLNWTRQGELWAGYLVGPQGNITPHKNHVALAVAKVKKHLGLTITDKEAAMLEKAEALETT